MTGENRKKLNRLLKEWSAGTLMTHHALKKRGIYQQLVDCYVKSGWLEVISRGVFKKAGDQVDWLAAVLYVQSSLQRSVHVGAKTALELHGVQHFTPHSAGYVWLFGLSNEKLPAWLLARNTEYNWGRDIHYLTPVLFDDQKLGLTKKKIAQYGNQEWQIVVSSKERAVLELLYLVPLKQSLEEAKY